MNWTNLLNNNRLRGSKRMNREDVRNDFESDFGRIIFSPALRRMHDKTQVFPLTSDDNIHSRLTHSMEVMSIGYSLGLKLCENEKFLSKFEQKDQIGLIREIPVLLKNICLVHDIGNPPFGHFGETVIQNYFKDLFKKSTITNVKEDIQKLREECSFAFDLTDAQISDFCNFDGNAQGLRVLTKLQILNDIFGLNLTFATLASFIKYPNTDAIDEKKISKSKIGVFFSEVNYFEEIHTACGLMIGGEPCRHPLSFLMEAADSICYLTMDIEDGFSKGLIDLNDYYDSLKSLPIIGKELTEIYVDENSYYKNDITKIVNFRIRIIQALVGSTIETFIKNIDKIEQGIYYHELLFDPTNNKLAQTLKDICSKVIFRSRDINSLEITGHSVIKGLLDYYISFVFHLDKKYRKRAAALISDSIIRAALEESGLSSADKLDDLNDYYKLKVIVDFITGMTDQFALSHFQKISGQKIS